MGRDKALLPFRGATLAAIAAQTVQAGAGAVALIGDPKLYGDLGFRVLGDRYPGEGPLGGILTALDDEIQVADWNLVTACDMPTMSEGFLRALFDAAEGADAEVLLPVDSEARPQPLSAVYHRRCRPTLQAAFDEGIRKVMLALERLRLVRLPVSEVAHFQNVNTPEDWAGYAAG